MHYVASGVPDSVVSRFPPIAPAGRAVSGPLALRQSAPEEYRHAEAGHEVDDLAGGLGFDPLGGQGPGVKAAPDQLLACKFL
jgi:hypothetical protein